MTEPTAYTLFRQLEKIHIGQLVLDNIYGLALTDEERKLIKDIKELLSKVSLSLHNRIHFLKEED